MIICAFKKINSLKISSMTYNGKPPRDELKKAPIPQDLQEL